MKIVIIGIGSFTFGPSVLAQTLAEHDLPDLELVLVDVDRGMAETMAAVARRMAGDKPVQITATTERQPALAGVDFVVCSASPGMQRRYATDCRIINEYLPGHQPTEFGGVAGLSNSLCQIRFIQELAADMRRQCPDAWLLNVANPLPRVCQAAYESGIRTIGFCSAALGLYGDLWQRFTGETCHYPYAAPRAAWQLTLAGLNHFVWLLEFRERSTGADLMPRLRESLRAVTKSVNPRCEALGRQTGYLLVPNDHHCQDFLVPDSHPAVVEPPWHGDPAERQTRRDLLAAIAAGREPWAKLVEHPSWERPGDLIAALTTDQPAQFDSLNLINTDRHVDNLPANVYVETPATVSRAGIQPHRLSLPATVLPYCARTALVTDTIVRAAVTGSLHLVDVAVELDPTITDKSAGQKALRSCIAALPDFMPAFHES